MTPDEIFLLFQLIQQIIGALAGQEDELADVARESRSRIIEERVSAIWYPALDPGVGFTGLSSAINAVRLDTASPHAATLTDILDWLAAHETVTLPVTPPPGYGGGEGSSTWPALIDVAQMCELDG